MHSVVEDPLLRSYRISVGISYCPYELLGIGVGNMETIFSSRGGKQWYIYLKATQSVEKFLKLVEGLRNCETFEVVNLHLRD